MAQIQGENLEPQLMCELLAKIVSKVKLHL